VSQLKKPVRTQYHRDRVHFHRFLLNHWEEAMKTVKQDEEVHRMKGKVKFKSLPLSAPAGTLRELVSL
jgi:hypothetical protein